MAATHVEMHGEHRQWLSDNCMWRDELAVWQQEVDQALQGLKKLEDTLRGHRKALHTHVETIGAEEQSVQAHEHVLAEFERGDPTDELKLLMTAKTHGKAADKHTQQRLAHERLKKRHHTVMAYWALLLKSLTQ